MCRRMVLNVEWRCRSAERERERDVARGRYVKESSKKWPALNTATLDFKTRPTCKCGGNRLGNKGISCSSSLDGTPQSPRNHGAVLTQEDLEEVCSSS